MRVINQGPRAQLSRVFGSRVVGEWRPVTSVASPVASVASVASASPLASRRVASVASVVSVASVACVASVASRERVQSAQSAKPRWWRVQSVASMVSCSVRAVLGPTFEGRRVVASQSSDVASRSVGGVRVRVACVGVPPPSPRSVLIGTLARSRRAAAQSVFARIEQRLAALDAARSRSAAAKVSVPAGSRSVAVVALPKSFVVPAAFVPTVRRSRSSHRVQ